MIHNDLPLPPVRALHAWHSVDASGQSLRDQSGGNRSGNVLIGHRIKRHDVRGGTCSIICSAATSETKGRRWQTGVSIGERAVFRVRVSYLCRAVESGDKRRVVAWLSTTAMATVRSENMAYLIVVNVTRAQRLVGDGTDGLDGDEDATPPNGCARGTKERACGVKRKNASAVACMGREGGAQVEGWL